LWKYAKRLNGIRQRKSSIRSKDDSISDFSTFIIIACESSPKNLLTGGRDFRAPEMK